MKEIMEFLGMIQNNGGMLFGIGYLIWTMRNHRSDFIHHAHDTDGKPFVQKRASDLS